MIFILTVLLIAPIILAMIWNGLHGKGYRVKFVAPPLDTRKGKLIRLGMFIYTAVLLITAFSSQYRESANDGYRGIERIANVAVFFLILFVVNIVMIRKQNK
jgi:hypothetical protein